MMDAAVPPTAVEAVDPLRFLQEAAMPWDHKPLLCTQHLVRSRDYRV